MRLIDIVAKIKDTPTIERKKGEWKWDSLNNDLHCSECKQLAPHSVDYGWWCAPYCPSCGAEMRGGVK